MLRKFARGSSRNLWDFGPVTVSACSDFICDGSHRWPKVVVIFRDRWLHNTQRADGNGKCIRYRRVSLPLPYVRWDYRQPVRSRISTALTRLYYRAFAPRYS
jgi:hypothetical protein